MSEIGQIDQLKAALANRYVIGRVLGSGGMATVYAAEDIRHGRQVAIKVLDPELAAALGAERFLREIQVTAALNHPHILTLHDSGEAEGRLYYVMPLVEGESLRERLRHERQLTIDEAIHLTTAIARALDYAHRHGVVHRDLKPENILLQDGQPLIADFGIALAVSRAGGTRITQTGLSLGTPQYMSPEQATADHAIDGRTDIYSLGAMLYEMLTGDPPFTGSTSQAVIAKILTDTPRSIRLMRPSVPMQLEEAANRALAKLPADRFPSGLEFAEALRRAYVSGDSNTESPRESAAFVSPPSRGTPWREVAAWTIAAAAIAFAFFVRRQPEGSGKVVRFQLVTSDSARLRASDGTTIALSRDGSRVVYAGGPETSGELFVRDLNSTVARPVRGTDRARSPFVSPDGRSVLFTADGHIKRVDFDGGAAVTLSERGGTASWGEAGIMFANSGSLYLIPVGSGTPRRVAPKDTASGIRLSWPYPLPGGKAALVTVGQGIDNPRGTAHIGVADLSDGSITDLGLVGASARYLPPGYIVYGTAEGIVYGVAFDAKTPRTSGPVVPLLNDVRVKNGRAMELAVSDDGTMVYRSDRIIGRVLLVDRHGVEKVLLSEPHNYTFPAVSPDGKKIALTIGASTATSDTWILNTQTGALTKLTEGGGERPEWMPDGKTVVLVRSDSIMHLVAQPWDGSGGQSNYLTARRPILEVSFPRQNTGYLAARVNAGGPRDIWIAPVDSPRALRPFVATDADEFAPSVSPDGRWLAYLSNESGRYEVFVRAMPTGPRVQISTDGAIEPRWSPTGKEVFYRANGKLVAASISWAGGAPSVTRTALFNDVYGSDATAHATYSVMPDGNSFVFVQPEDPNGDGFVVVNWAQEVRQKIEAAKSK